MDDDEDLDHMDYDKTNTYATNNLLSANQVQPQQQQQEVFTPPPPQQNLPQQSQVTPPSKPLAPYALFFRDTMTAIKQQNPACTLEQITSIAMNMWESIDEKQKSVYDQRHEQEKREYLRQLRDYQRNQQLDEAMPNPEQSQQQPQQQQEQHIPQLQPQEEQQLPQNDVQPSIPPLSIPATETETTTVQSQTQQPPDQIQLLTEAAAVQKCTRDQCNKPAIINPDWEDEYCSNECVVIHCHNVFREWARSLQNSPT